MPTVASRPRSSAVSAAATDESTPPDMATTEIISGRAAFGSGQREQRLGRDFLLGRLRLRRDPEGHLGARIVMLPLGLRLGRALQPDVPPVRLDDLLGHGQAQPR